VTDSSPDVHHSAILFKAFVFPTASDPGLMPEPPKNRAPIPPVEWPARPAPDNSPANPAVDKGKVVHDARGNAKWDLGLDTARVKKLTTSQLLKKLDVEELSLLDEGAAKPKPGGGFEPYETAPDRRPAENRRPARDPFRADAGGTGQRGGKPAAANPPPPKARR
jgi:hypothetical protein